MLKHSIIYSIRLLVLFAAGMAFMGWLFVSKLRNLDELPSLSDAMGLSRDWNGRVAVLEKRHPWRQAQVTSWGSEELDAFLGVKMRLLPAIREWHRRHARGSADPAGPSDSTEGMLSDLLSLRAMLLTELEKHRLSLSAYLFFDRLAAACVAHGAAAPESGEPTASQLQALNGRLEQLRAIDTGGLEYLGLPH